MPMPYERQTQEATILKRSVKRGTFVTVEFFTPPLFAECCTISSVLKIFGLGIYVDCVSYSFFHIFSLSF